MMMLITIVTVFMVVVLMILKVKNVQKRIHAVQFATSSALSIACTVLPAIQAAAFHLQSY